MQARPERHVVDAAAGAVDDDADVAGADIREARRDDDERDGINESRLFLKELSIHGLLIAFRAHGSASRKADEFALVVMSVRRAVAVDRTFDLPAVVDLPQVCAERRVVTQNGEKKSAKQRHEGDEEGAFQEDGYHSEGVSVYYGSEESLVSKCQ
jgi:hypothetical protein